GESPYVAKVLVQIFALVAGLYLLAWLRRWIAPEAGWAAPLLLLQPGFILWSHTVMLNVPSVAIGLAALWHLRRWIETATSRHVYPGMILTCLGIMTYLTTGVVVAIFVVWLVAERRWAVLLDRRAWLLAPLLGLLLLPWAFVVYHWAPAHLHTVYATSKPFFYPPRWKYYLESLPQLTTPALLALAAMGIVLGFFGAVERRETKWVLLWSVVCYVFFSLIIAKAPRYALLLSPAGGILTAIGLWRLARWGANYLSANSSWVFLGLTGIVTAGHLWSASLVRVPYIDGFKEVAAYFKEVAPEEMVFYDGIYEG